MKKRLLTYSLLALGQLIYLSSSVIASADVDLRMHTGHGVAAGHMHHKDPSAVIPIEITPLSQPSVVAIYKVDEWSGALSDEAEKTISLVSRSGYTLSEVLTSAYPAVRGFFVGPIAKLNAGELSLIPAAFSNLRKLTLCSTASLSAEELASELPKLRHLEELNITGKNITDDVVKALADHLAGTLRRLHLNGASLTAAGIEELQRLSNLT